MTNTPSSKPGNRRFLGCCGGCLGIFLLACCGIVALGALAPMLRPSARDVYAGAPDLAAGQDVSQALIESGMQGATVLVLPIKGSSGQIAIITLDESQGYTGLSAGSTDNLQPLVAKIVDANRAGNYRIERLSIDYRDISGERTMAFTTTIQAAEDYADGHITQQEFMGNVEFSLTDSLLFFGIDATQLLQEGEQP